MFELLDASEDADGGEYEDELPLAGISSQCCWMRALINSRVGVALSSFYISCILV